MQTPASHEASWKQCGELVCTRASRCVAGSPLILHCEDSSLEGFGGPIRAKPMQATRNRDDECFSWRQREGKMPCAFVHAIRAEIPQG